MQNLEMDPIYNNVIIAGTIRRLDKFRQRFFFASLLTGMGVYLLAGSFSATFIVAFLQSSYLINGLGMNASDAGTVFSFSAATGALAFLTAVIIGGCFSDDLRSRFGNRLPNILLGAFFAGIVYIFAPNFISKDNAFVLLPIILGLINFGVGWGSSPHLALLSELFTKKERGWAGLALAGFATIGTFFGFVILDSFKVNENYEMMWISAGILLMICSLITFIFLPKTNPSHPGDSTFRDILLTPVHLINFGKGDFGKMFVVQSFWGFSFTGVIFFFVSYLTQIGHSNPQMALMITGVMGAIAAVPVGFVISKIGKVRTGMIGSILYAIACFGFSAVSEGIFGMDLEMSFYVLAGIAGVGAIFIQGVQLSLPADLVPEGKEAQFMGLNTFGQTWTDPLVTIAGGLIISSFGAIVGYPLIFQLAGASQVFAVMILALITYERLLEREYERFRRRYLAFRFLIEDQIERIVDAVI